MHFEILVEDQSGKEALEILVPTIIGVDHTFKIHSYKGLGRIPKVIPKLNNGSIASRVLLNKLPNILRGYGKSLPRDFGAVFVVCDLDEKNKEDFLCELKMVLKSCNPKPNVRFCLAVEEGEAWFLGDIPAIKSAYPNAKDAVLNGYVNDSICGTWELLADALYKGGAAELKQGGFQTVGSEKSKWANNISPYMDIENNLSPSFCFFRDQLIQFIKD